ncbi:MAG: helix-turn-helix transcriptional regulator [Alphaproteobacteria bacterium]|nr:helix-turn-helix transcriptional regulator [Alphaproteobacteria bacterium]
MKHSEIWKAIDKLAEIKGVSPSSLAKKAGLDPTAFNKSKRFSSEGRKRWPSMESINKLLRSAEMSIFEFASYAEEGQYTGPAHTIPLIGFAQAGNDGYFDDAGYPAGSEGWDGIDFPDVKDPNAYALEVSGSSMEPAYRDGDRLLISPESSIRRGDRVVVRTSEGEVMVKELRRETAMQIELKSLNPEHPDRTIPKEKVMWIARVLWVSQ